MDDGELFRLAGSLVFAWDLTCPIADVDRVPNLLLGCRVVVLASELDRGIPDSGAV
jgi:hypothetical protein